MIGQDIPPTRQFLAIIAALTPHATWAQRRELRSTLMINAAKKAHNESKLGRYDWTSELRPGALVIIANLHEI